MATTNAPSRQTPPKQTVPPKDAPELPKPDEAELPKVMDDEDPFAALTLVTDREPHPKMVEFIATGRKDMKTEQNIALPTRAMYAEVCDGLATAAKKAGVGVSVWEWTDPPSKMRDAQDVKDGRTFRGVAFKVTAKRGAAPQQR